ncbi:MAG: choice-of-anchor Q domain-containing protein, partial [Planctomycetota bacterium]
MQADAAEDTIRFAPSLSGRSVLLEYGQLEITGTVEIIGPGAEALSIDGADASRVLHVDSSGEAKLEGLSIVGGSTSGDGGGIRNLGVVELREVHVDGNRAAGSGGGIYHAADATGLTIASSVVRDNAAADGGGISSGAASRLVVADSAVVENRAESGVGGGLQLVDNAAQAHLSNVTFSGNSAALGGGAIALNAAAADATVVNGTMTNNVAEGGSAGGGVALIGGALTLHNTIVVGNAAGAAGTNDLDGDLDAVSSHNLFGQATVAKSTGGDFQEGELQNRFGRSAAEIFTLDSTGAPRLADAGGLTPTHPLRPGSVAIDAGDNAQAKDADDGALSTDQRGFARVVEGPDGVGAAVDIGAYEGSLQIIAATDFNGDGRSDRLSFDIETSALTVLAGTAVPGEFEAQAWGELGPGAGGTSGWDLGAAVAGDFDGDGRDDFWIRDAGDNRWTLALSDGGQFYTQRFNSVPLEWQAAVAGDFDGDGADEVAVRYSWAHSWQLFQYDASVADPTQRAQLQPGGGFSLGYYDYDFQAGDMNGDGRDDLIVKADQTTPWAWRVALSTGETGELGSLGTTIGAIPEWFDGYYDQATGKISDISGPYRDIVEAFESVYNHVELELYPGFMKGPTATEQTAAGNPFDQAALLVDKLEALPSLRGQDVEIAVGKVRVAEERWDDLFNWLGVRDVEAAVGVLKASFDSSAEQIGNAIEFMHAWVRVRVPVGPEFIYVDLDPSWKLKERQNADGAIAVNLSNPRGIFDELEYLRLDPDEDHRLPFEVFEDQAQRQLTQDYPGKSLADVPYDGPIVAKQFKQLPAGLADGVDIVSPASVTTLQNLAAVAADPTHAEAYAHRTTVSLDKRSPSDWSYQDVVSLSAQTFPLLDPTPYLGQTAYAAFDPVSFAATSPTGADSILEFEMKTDSNQSLHTYRWF